MADLVNLADVLEEAESDFFQAAIPNCGLGNALSRAVLAYGGGDPVVMEAVIITVPVVPE